LDNSEHYLFIDLHRARHCWTCLLVSRGYPSSPADLDIPLPCCSAPLPSTLRTPSTLSLMKAPGRGCWSGNSSLLLPCFATSSLPLLELVVPIADLGVVKPPRKLQRDLMRAAHALVFQRLMDSPHCVRDARGRDAFLPFLAAPSSAALIVEPPHFTAGLRSFLLLPQLLRLSTPPVLVDPPASSDAPDFSHEAQ
jgi:hypothetical protein